MVGGCKGEGVLEAERRIEVSRREWKAARGVAEERSREDTPGGFSGVEGRGNPRRLFPESGEVLTIRRYVVANPPLRARARRVDNRFREGASRPRPWYYRLCGRCLNAAGTRAISSIHNQRTFRVATDRHHGNRLSATIKSSCRYTPPATYTPPPPPVRSSNKFQ